MSSNRKIKDNMESEWELYYPGMEDEAFKQNASNVKKDMESEWEVYYPPEPKESLFESITQAPFRIAGDIGKVASSAYQAAPNYLEKAKTEIPGLYQTAKEHPGHLLGQMAAGIPEMGQKVFNTPHKMIEYGANRLHLLPEQWGQVAQMAEMPDRSEAINEIFGEPQYPGEAMMRGLTRNLDIAIPATKAAALLIPTTNKGLAKTIWKKHDAIENRAVQGFSDVSQMARERGVPNVPIHNTVDMNKIEKYFPNTDEAKELLNRAKVGDYDALRKVQSDLFHEGNKSLKSTKSTERHKGAKMHQERNRINQAISDNLVSTGNYDLADILSDSMRDYKTLKDVYYNKNMSKSIKNLVGKNRKIPKDMRSVLNEDSKAMKQFKEFHPGLETKASKYGLQKGLKKALTKALIYGGLPAGGLGTYEYLKGK